MPAAPAGWLRSSGSPSASRSTSADPRGALLGAADLLIHPARRELGGLVLLEAMAAGVPTIRTAACAFAARGGGGGRDRPRVPFQQIQLDQALATMLAAPLDSLGEAGLAYAARVDLHGKHRRVADDRGGPPGQGRP